jgi:hypothetical protein
VADNTFTAGGVTVQKGDYVIRGDQPYRTLADMYFSTQNYPAGNPRPYDDTGWTFQLMRNVVMNTIGDTTVFAQRMTKLTGRRRRRAAWWGAGRWW